jgi:hypothetical protein
MYVVASLGQKELQRTAIFVCFGRFSERKTLTNKD